MVADLLDQLLDGETIKQTSDLAAELELHLAKVKHSKVLTSRSRATKTALIKTQGYDHSVVRKL